MPSSETIEIAREIRAAYAPRTLSGRQAILYSQRQRLAMGRAGLSRFIGAASYLDEALLLIDCALLEKEDNTQNVAWIAGIKRAAELLEWISETNLRPERVPVHLLSAAAYQLAGLPAMALGLLARTDPGASISAILGNLLKADFPSTLNAVRGFWRAQEAATDQTEGDFSLLAIQHTVVCIGNLCMYFRTGNPTMVGRVLTKMDALAKGYLQSRDSYSYLLARLTSLTCRQYFEDCLWNHVEALRDEATPTTQDVINQFVRSAYKNKRLLVWPAQAVGFSRLAEGGSFVLCTPTGSGKTSVATMAIVQSLYEARFSDVPGFENLTIPNLVLYLVPSRALAAEVETRLAQDLQGISNDPAVVTGLYGGVDWGPTDAWIQSDSPTTVICTFEKADALIRYLGVLFLDRVRLVVIDEAHMVEQDTTKLDGIADGSSRSYRLEQLGSRLLYAQTKNDFRIIALSAVAAQAAPAIARWISSDPTASPSTSSHRSTRQMLGRLEIDEGRQYTIQYDLMDGRSLKFEDGTESVTPFVPSPIPNYPTPIDYSKPEVAIRAPALWAAMHLAADRIDGSSSSVLISITQNIGPFATTCLSWLEDQAEESLPRYQVGNRDDRWTRCLASAADYFSKESTEYRLLEKGIAVHHGKMPGLLARRLKLVIDCGYVRVIIATSTLSEGVNIPVNYLILPTLHRGKKALSFQEFTNLIGRVGRPGVATEGQAFALLPVYQKRHVLGAPSREFRNYRESNRYNELKDQLEQATASAASNTPSDQANSALSKLLGELNRLWREANLGSTDAEFSGWLERTAVPESSQPISPLLAHLDSLDSFLMSAVHEIEELSRAEVAGPELERELQLIWQHTYAFASNSEEARLRAFWMKRGEVIKTRYPDRAQRRQIYKTSLSPRSARILVESSDAIKAKLIEGTGYALWDIEQRLTFIGDVLELLSAVPSFAIGTKLGKKKGFQDWRGLLRWWLAKSTVQGQPKPNQITNWFDFVSQNFIYRSVWGIGGILGLLLDLGDGQNAIRALEIADWPRSGLPWITFWLKEIITWGTLDPVAAFLLAKGNRIDRNEAEAESAIYYSGVAIGTAANEILDPRTIRDWMTNAPAAETGTPRLRQLQVRVDLARDETSYVPASIRVMPLERNNRLEWIDAGGYGVAQSVRPARWTDDPDAYDFELDVQERQVTGTPFLAHRI